MTIIEIKNFKKRVAKLIDDRRLRQAIKELRSKIQQQSAWQVRDFLDRTEQAYGLMLGYVAQGVADPERNEVYMSIVTDLYSILDQVIQTLEQEVSTTQYYSTQRFMLRQHNRIEGIDQKYRKAQDDLSLFLLMPNAEDPQQKEALLKAEGIEKDYFDAVWVEPKINHADFAILTKAMEDDVLSEEFKLHLISAISLGLMQVFDPARMDLLMQTYQQSQSVRLQAAALVGLLFALWMYQNRPLPKKQKVRLDIIKDTERWASDLRTACIEMIRTTDTERINKKIREEIVPGMMNLKPEILQKIKGGGINPEDMASLEENPEWQEMLDKNGITDKLKELTEMQMEGGDVMMGTFSHLKNFPFFNELSNWFLPFSSTHTAVIEAANRLGVMEDMIEGAVFLCDSDKYSFMFALQMVPEEQRQAMTSQFKVQRDNIYEQMGEQSDTDRHEAMRRSINSYLQNVNRFFKLYRRKEEFVDPFAKGINLISVPALADDFDDVDMLEVVAEFYFKLGYMSDSLSVFEKLEKIMPGDASRYQKMGFAYEHNKQWTKAIKNYEMAELLDTESLWTTRRMATCYRAMGNGQKALEYYKKWQDKQPDDLNAALMLGYALLELNRLDEALQQFYKVEFIGENTNKALRPLAWTLFLLGKYKEAMDYYYKLIEDGANSTDYLNMGHVALALGDVREAINYYKLSVDASNADTFIKEMGKDSEHLVSAGVDPNLLPILIDAVI